MAEAKDIEVANLAKETPTDKGDYDFDFINADDNPVAPEKVEDAKPEPKADAPPPIPQYLADMAASLGIDPKGTAEELGAAIHQAVKAKQSQPVKHPTSLLKAAHALGINYQGMSTDDLADLVLHIQNERRAEQPKPAVDDDEAMLQALEADGIDKRFLGILKKQKQKINELEGVTKERHERESSRRRMANEEAVDEALDQLVEQHPVLEKVIGKGSARDMPAGEQRDTRGSIFKAAGVDLENDAPSVIQRKVMRAGKSIYKIILDEIANNKPPEKPPGKLTEEEWDRAATRKPTASDPVLGKREKSLLAATKDFLHRNGLSNRDDASDDFDRIPD